MKSLRKGYIPGSQPFGSVPYELEEEIRYKAGRFKIALNIFTAPGFADEVIHVYVATAPDT